MASPSSSSSIVPLTLYIHSGASGNGHQGGQRLSTRFMVLYVLAKTGLGTHAPFSPAQIRSAIKEFFGVVIDRRRVQEQLMDLVYKGALEKLRRGLYIMRNPGKILAELKRLLTGSKEDTVLATGLQHQGAACGSCAVGRGRRARRGSGLVVSFDGCYVVFRWHRRIGRAASGDPVGVLLGLIEALSLLRGVFEDALREAKGLARRVGVSWYQVRRAVGEAQRLLRLLRRRGRVVIGAHGCEGRRCGKRGQFYPFEEYVRLVTGNSHPEAWFKEIGADYVVCPGEGVDAAELGKVEELARSLLEAIGSDAKIYVPLYGRGARKHKQLWGG